MILPGNSAESKLIRRLVNGDGGLQMPPSGPLSDEEIGILRAWIDQGADFRIQVQEEPPPSRSIQKSPRSSKRFVPTIPKPSRSS